MKSSLETPKHSSIGHRAVPHDCCPAPRLLVPLLLLGGALPVVACADEHELVSEDDLIFRSVDATPSHEVGLSVCGLAVGASSEIYFDGARRKRREVVDLLNLPADYEVIAGRYCGEGTDRDGCIQLMLDPPGQLEPAVYFFTDVRCSKLTNGNSGHPQPFCLGGSVTQGYVASHRIVTDGQMFLDSEDTTFSIRDTIQVWGEVEVPAVWTGPTPHEWKDVVALEQSYFREGTVGGSGLTQHHVVSTIYDGTGAPIDSIARTYKIIPSEGQTNTGGCASDDAECRWSERADTRVATMKSTLGDDVENLAAGALEGLEINGTWSNFGFGFDGGPLAKRMDQNRAERYDDTAKRVVAACMANPAAWFPGEFTPVVDTQFEAEKYQWLAPVLTDDCSSMNFGTTEIWDSTDPEEEQAGEICQTVTTKNQSCTGSFGCTCTVTVIHAETCVSG